MCGVNSETQIYSERSGIEPIAVGDLRQVPNEPTKVLALSDDTDVIDQLLGSLRQQYTPELYLTVATFFEATNPWLIKELEFVT